MASAGPAAAVTGPRFDARVAGLVAADRRRIVVVGAGGWIGRTVVEMLRAALGAGDFAERVRCFGSQARDLIIADGTRVPQQALADLAELPAEPTLLLHLAFLTKDRVGGMAEADYVAGNRAISDAVAGALAPLGVDRLFVASSGAAAFAQDPAAAQDLRLYGGLKRADEDRFAAWAGAAAGRRVATGRLYALSGPFINKPETYALADLILSALAGRAPTVKAPIAVWRSYVAVRELVSLVFAALLGEGGDAVLRFDTGGEPLELGDLARRVAGVLGRTAADRVIGAGPASRYCGDHGRWLDLLVAHGLNHLPIEAQIAETADWLRATHSSQGPARVASPA